MRLVLILIIGATCISCAQTPVELQDSAITESIDTLSVPSGLSYSWLSPLQKPDLLVNRFEPPKGYAYDSLASGTFSEWLRYLPMEPKGTKIKLYNGKKKMFQYLNAGVIKIDVGTKDLQQCADAVIRLRAEYLYSIKQYKNIRFNYTSGFNAEYQKWRDGFKIKVAGNNVSYYSKPKDNDKTYAGFKSYLINVYNYAGTYSLDKELKKESVDNISAGDVLIIGGFPGHVVMIMATATNKDGKKAVLLGQSYMPAQSIHIIKNQNKPLKGAWFMVEDLNKKGWNTVEWSYKKEHLKTW